MIKFWPFKRRPKPAKLSEFFCRDSRLPTASAVRRYGHHAFPSDIRNTGFVRDHLLATVMRDTLNRSCDYTLICHALSEREAETLLQKGYHYKPVFEPHCTIISWAIKPPEGFYTKASK